MKNTLLQIEKTTIYKLVNFHRTDDRFQLVEEQPIRILVRSGPLSGLDSPGSNLRLDLEPDSGGKEDFSRIRISDRERRHGREEAGAVFEVDSLERSLFQSETFTVVWLRKT